jgi:hypothetical protein
MDLERRLGVLRMQRQTCHRMLRALPDVTPRVIVIAAKRACNDIEADFRRVVGRLRRRTARHS